MKTLNLYEAKTHLSSLVDEAEAGAEIVISKNGKPKAKLVPFEPPAPKQPRKPAGVLGVVWIADDFDEPDPELIALFEGDHEDGEEQ
ncbi:type II toxin-antitoxin system Phd/YefM family antitoxin [Indioceanicola profundi]|uniref:type II toxin-antitoxin system Phd/YefM family antitoxin n=1 Tax=Indioceanicola profundi TaxID=2220096 RepID=UPI000E6ADAAA|nr:type II toxin-antitoxin system Phd/YefM family antitoxin [Indioceanicola profundi]